MSIREIIIEAPVTTPYRGHDNIAGPRSDDEGRSDSFRREIWHGHRPQYLWRHASSLWLLAEVEGPETAGIISESVALEFTKAWPRAPGFIFVDRDLVATTTTCAVQPSRRPATSRLLLPGLIPIGFLMALLGCGNQSPAERAASQPRSATPAPVGSVPLTEISEPTGPIPVPASRISADPSPPEEPQFDESFAGVEAGQMRNDNGLKLELVWCPPGEFLMRSPAEEHGADDVDPGQVRVILHQGFWLGKYEVTQAQWKQIVETEPWRGGEDVREGADYPATFVSWDDAMEFCRKLTEQEQIAGHLPGGWHITLPTEAQWEYACRGGTTSGQALGDDPILECAWFAENSTRVKESYAHRVGLKRPNAWGLHDMRGNVWELCRDVYDERIPGGRDPEITAGSGFRVIRGGSWNYRAGICRWDRLWNAPSFRYNYVGFRLAWIPVGHR